MAATYINGNTFRVDFILWRKDIVSYFWHSYFFAPFRNVTKTETQRFIHALGYASLLTGSVMLASSILHIENFFFLAIYFPIVIFILIMSHYRKTIQSSQPLVGRHYSFHLDNNRIKIIDNQSKEEATIDGTEIISIGEKKNMLIIYTKKDEYILPKRVLTPGQIASIRTFKAKG